MIAYFDAVDAAAGRGGGKVHPGGDADRRRGSPGLERIQHWADDVFLEFKAAVDELFQRCRLDARAAPDVAGGNKARGDILRGLGQRRTLADDGDTAGAAGAAAPPPSPRAVEDVRDAADPSRRRPSLIRKFLAPEKQYELEDVLVDLMLTESDALAAATFRLAQRVRAQRAVLLRQSEDVLLLAEPELGDLPPGWAGSFATYPQLDDRVSDLRHYVQSYQVWTNGPAGAGSPFADAEALLREILAFAAVSGQNQKILFGLGVASILAELSSVDVTLGAATRAASARLRRLVELSYDALAALLRGADAAVAGQVAAFLRDTPVLERAARDLAVVAAAAADARPARSSARAAPAAGWQARRHGPAQTRKNLMVDHLAVPPNAPADFWQKCAVPRRRRKDPPLHPDEEILKPELFKGDGSGGGNWTNSAQRVYRVVERLGREPSPVFLVLALNQVCRDPEAREDRNSTTLRVLDVLAKTFDESNEAHVAWTPKMLAIMTMSLTKLFARGREATTIRHGIVRQVVECADEFDGRGAANVCWALGKCVSVFDVASSAPLFEALAPRIVDLLPEIVESKFAARDLSEIAWGVFKVGWRDRCRVLLPLSEASVEVLPRFITQDLANLAQALASLDRSRDVERWFEEAWKRCPMRQLLENGLEYELAGIAKYFAKHAPVDVATELVYLVGREVSHRLNMGAPFLAQAVQEASMLAYAIGTVITRGGSHLAKLGLDWTESARGVLDLVDDVALDPRNDRDVRPETYRLLALGFGGAQVPSRFFETCDARRVANAVVSKADLREMAIALNRLVVINFAGVDELREACVRRAGFIIAEARANRSDGVGVLWALVVAARPDDAREGFRDLVRDLWTGLLDAGVSHDDDRSQLAQVWLSLRHETDWTAGLPEPPSTWAATLTSQGVRVSRAQKSVSQVLRECGFAHEMEVDLDGTGLTADAADVDARVAVEYDGPQHYLADRTQTGRTRFKHRLVRALGWRLVVVSHYGWEQASDKRAYVEDLLARPSGVGAAGGESRSTNGRRTQHRDRRRAPEEPATDDEGNPEDGASSSAARPQRSLAELQASLPSAGGGRPRSSAKSGGGKGGGGATAARAAGGGDEALLRKRLQAKERTIEQLQARLCDVQAAADLDLTAPARVAAAEAAAADALSRAAAADTARAAAEAGRAAAEAAAAEAGRIIEAQKVELEDASAGAASAGALDALRAAAEATATDLCHTVAAQKTELEAAAGTVRKLTDISADISSRLRRAEVEREEASARLDDLSVRLRDVERERDDKLAQLSRTLARTEAEHDKEKQRHEETKLKLREKCELITLRAKADVDARVAALERERLAQVSIPETTPDAPARAPATASDLANSGGGTCVARVLDTLGLSGKLADKFAEEEIDDRAFGDLEAKEFEEVGASPEEARCIIECRDALVVAFPPRGAMASPAPMKREVARDLLRYVRTQGGSVCGKEMAPFYRAGAHRKTILCAPAAADPLHDGRVPAGAPAHDARAARLRPGRRRRRGPEPPRALRREPVARAARPRLGGDAAALAAPRRGDARRRARAHHRQAPGLGH